MADKANIFTEKSLFKIVWPEIIKQNPCDSAIIFFDGLLKKNPEITYEKAINSIPKPSWAIWCANEFRAHMDSKVCSLFYSHITDPMQALKCYQRTAHSSEKGTLKLLFQGKLPTAEKELRAQEQAQLDQKEVI